MSQPSKSERTRTRILDAAEELFAEKGFDAVSLRAIARRAGVDPALLHHYFGSKEGLFAGVLNRIINPEHVQATVLDGGRESWGVGLVHAADTLWKSASGRALIALFKRAISGQPEMMQRFLTATLLGRIIPQLEGPRDEKRIRASLVASQMSGLLLSRHVLGIEPLASMSTEQVAGLVGPVVQGYLTGELDLD